DPVVDPDDGPVAYRMVVGGDRWVPLGVVAHVDKRLGGVLRHLDPLQQVAGRSPLLHDGREAVTGGAVGIAHGIGATLGDPGQESLGSQRPIHSRIRTEAVTGYSTH